MRECTIDQISVTYRWTFDKMLHSLPVPGTAGFATLCQRLAGYGMSPSGTSIEAPSTILSDVALRIWLLEDRIKLRVGYSFVEVFATHFAKEDDKVLVGILEAMFAALRESDPSADQGRALVNCQIYLSFSDLDPEEFLMEHLRGAESSLDLVPDAFAYKVKWNVASEDQTTRVAIAKSTSLLFPNALFFDFSVQPNPATPAEMVERVGDGLERALALFGFQLRTASQAND